MIRLTTFYSSILILFTFLCGYAQTAPAHDWHLQDPETDQVQGVSAEKAYATLLKGKPSKSVIVAVIDGGVDIEHEDLKRVIWTNGREIPDNGLDDDKNGYIDDVHGWNFIGGAKGDVNEDTYELTREYMRLEKLFRDTPESKIPRKQKSQYEDYKKIKEKYIKLRDQNQAEYELYGNLNKNLKMSIDTLQLVMGVDRLTREVLDTFRTSNPRLAFAKGFISGMMRRMGPDSDIESISKELNEASEHYRVIVQYGYNATFDSREVIGDYYENMREKNYGNNHVKGPDADHGTHVAGIIAADRTNDLGIKGISDNVIIMPVRAVPNGDERDKDIANAIRYAVDNGAQIINMSFGKGYSPEKVVVDEAVMYADQKGVLLIHASGNESDDSDKNMRYPNRQFLNGKEARNWLEVGASAAGSDDKLAGSFSNYGKKTVDLFAPGVDIYSTTPENKYVSQSGTSMASPAAAGVAALLWSYFPDLTVTQVIDILSQSTRKFDGLQVQKPGGGTAMFGALSSTGGVINAYEAVKMAIAIKSTPANK